MTCPENYCGTYRSVDLKVRLVNESSFFSCELLTVIDQFAVAFMYGRRVHVLASP